MRTSLSMLLAAIVVAVNVMAQPPQAFKYQAVVRDASGEPVCNQNVGFRLKIFEGSLAGTVLYAEVQNAVTNDFGLVNLSIGEGTVQFGTFAGIDWGSGPKVLKVECDPEGGTSYEDLGSTELQSVPYALYSGRSSDSYWEMLNDDVFYTDGRVGIGTSVPSYPLHVKTTAPNTWLAGFHNTGTDAADHGFHVRADGGDPFLVQNNTSNLFIVKNSGHVGVGTIDPAYPLHVKSSTFGTWLAGFHNTNTNSTSHGVVIRADGGDPLLVQHSVANLFCVKANGNVGIGTSTPDAALHVDDRIRVGEDPSNPTVYGEIIHAGGSSGFKLNANAGGGWADMHFQTDGTTKMFLESAGNVGIGTTSLSNARLTIEGTGAYDAMMKINNTGTDGAAFFMGSTNSSWGGGVNANRFVMGHGAPSSANIDLCIASSGSVGIGTTAPMATLDVSSSSNYAIYGHSTESTGVWASSGTSNGIFAQSQTGWAGYFSGNVYVNGSLGKGSGSFIIDHPLDPENKLLRHNFVESPENLVIYRGKVQLNSMGEATVTMPDYFRALTKEDEASIHLTPVGRPFLTGAEWNGDFSALIIYGDENREVYWEVLADRDDPVIHELGRPVEEEKGGENTLCEKGKLLYPRAYGYPESAGRDYEMIRMGAENDNLQH